MQREVNASVLDEPAAVVGEVNDAAFAWKKEEVLGTGNRKGGVCFFGARGDFGADGANEHLYGDEEGKMVSKKREMNVEGLLQWCSKKKLKGHLKRSFFSFREKPWIMGLFPSVYAHGMGKKGGKSEY